MWGIYARTFFRGTYVGKDHVGNRYYKDKKHQGPWYREPRWVLYKGMAEASKVAVGWYGWLHRIYPQPPCHNQKRYPWMKKRLPNLTGTPYAFSLQNTSSNHEGHVYRAWAPPETNKKRHNKRYAK